MALTKKGALLITNDLDRVATVIAEEYQTLDIPDKVAAGFAEWCDRISDRIERSAGINPQDKAAKRATLKEALSGQQDHKTDYPFDEGKTYDSEEIGEEVGGRLEGDSDETFMQGEFTQQESRELRQMQEGGGMPSPNTAPRSPRPGVQASLSALADVVKQGSFEGEGSEKLAEALKLATEIAKSVSTPARRAGHGYQLDA